MTFAEAMTLNALLVELSILEQEWRKHAAQMEFIARGAQTDMSRYTNIAGAQNRTACANDIAKLLKDAGGH